MDKCTGIGTSCMHNNRVHNNTYIYYIDVQSTFLNDDNNKNTKTTRDTPRELLSATEFANIRDLMLVCALGVSRGGGSTLCAYICIYYKPIE